MGFWTSYRDGNFGWVGVNINLPEEDLYVKDWQEIEINGNTVYFREGSDEYGNWIFYRTYPKTMISRMIMIESTVKNRFTHSLSYISKCLSWPHHLEPLGN